MLRRQPTSVTLSAEDVEVFKQLLQDQKKNTPTKKQDQIATDDGDLDDIFLGRSLVNERKRRREVDSRLGLVAEDEEEKETKLDTETEKSASSSSSEPLFKRVHL